MTGPADQPLVLVVGAGSIGARHARNLVAAGAAVVVTDPDADRAASVASDAGAAALPFDLDRLAAAGTLAGAVVASPTSHHAEQTEALLGSAPRLLVEKPLALDPATADRLAAHAERVAVAFNLRFHEPIRRLVDHCRAGTAGTISSVDLWFGSWLPAWRPAVDYRTTYSAQRAQGGGVLLDVIHELDLLRWIAGDPAPDDLAVLGASVARRGPLDIDVEDTVRAIVELPSGAVATIALDYLARRYRRGIEVTGSDATIRLDWARGVLEVEDADHVERSPADVAVDESYRRQDEAFVAWLRGGSPLPVDARLGAAANHLAAAIRGAAPEADR